MRKLLGRRERLSTRCLVVFLLMPCLAVCHGQCWQTPTITSITPSPWFAGGTYKITIAGTYLTCAPFASVEVDRGTATLSNVTFVSPSETTATVSIGADTPTEKACVSVVTNQDGPIQLTAAADSESSCVSTGEFEAAKTVQIYETAIQAQNVTPTLNLQPEQIDIGKSAAHTAHLTLGGTFQFALGYKRPMAPLNP